MADFESIIKNHTGEDGSIPAEAIAKLTKAISTAVGNEFVEKSRYKAKLEEIDTLKGEKQTAEDGATTAAKWKTKYEALKGEFDTYKGEQAAKETHAAKEKAVRAYYESKNITGNNLALAMRGSREEVEAVELTEDGKIKDTSTLDALIAGDLSGLVSTTTVRGASTANPPANTGGGTKARNEIYKTENGRFVLSASERQAEIAKQLQSGKGD